MPEDKDLMAAIGEVVVYAAVLEYAVAVLVALIEGNRDQACEDRAIEMVKHPGGAVRGLRKLTCVQLREQGLSPEQITRQLRRGQKVHLKDVRRDLDDWDSIWSDASPVMKHRLLLHWSDVTAVLSDRHVLAHSLALDDVTADGQPGLVIFHPGSGQETQITTPQVLSHAQDIRIAWRRVSAAIDAEAAPRES